MKVSDNIQIEKNISGKFDSGYDVEILQGYIESKLNERNLELKSNESIDNSYNNIASDVEFDNLNFERNYKITNSTNYFSNTQKWLGHVYKIDNDSFSARLKDLTKGGTDEFGEFSIALISDDDKELLKEGAAFYWTVGIQNIGTTVYNSSVIKFQRLIAWEFDDFIDAHDKGLNLDSELKWEYLLNGKTR